MPAFTERTVCAAPPAQVWRLVHDPERMPEWLVDTERVEGGDDGTVTRYLHGWPDFPMPTRVTTRADGARVVISCLVSDIDIRVALEPHPAGCAVEMEVCVPEAEAARLPAARRLAVDSLARLSRITSAGAAALG
ncbi:SRPBCC family protein [Miltoncostaea marina]|uniref:SRPBCC family protein n=1 Tax=Miltoncostaea marina TaxID=2843215 RepID=UPI001C3C6D92|nr:SRPBCC family protein [Miltoncostaea marina]